MTTNDEAVEKLADMLGLKGFGMSPDLATAVATDILASLLPLLTPEDLGMVKVNANDKLHWPWWRYPASSEEVAARGGQNEVYGRY